MKKLTDDDLKKFIVKNVYKDTRSKREKKKDELLYQLKLLEEGSFIFDDDNPGRNEGLANEITTFNDPLLIDKCEDLTREFRSVCVALENAGLPIPNDVKTVWQKHKADMEHQKAAEEGFRKFNETYKAAMNKLTKEEQAVLGVNPLKLD